MTQKFKFNTTEEIIADIKAGRIVIITDDEARENEGDFLFAAEAVDAEKINFLTKHGRGLICAPMGEERLTELGIRDMVEKNTDAKGTAFTVSVDARSGVTTGISAHDRARTVEVLVDPASRPGDLTTPGHIFPLRARRGGVLERAGHTEAAVDLARLAGRKPAGVICEIMSEDGTMARLAELFVVAKRFGLKIGTIADLIAYRHRFDKLVEFEAEAELPTGMGRWRTKLYRSLVDGKEHVALIQGDISKGPVLVRVHSECFTGDVLGSLRCDCRAQLIGAMELIHKTGTGVVLYMRQEGRGIGLANKLKAYTLQDKGYDTVEANEALGFKPDLRDYGIGAQILADLGLREIRLITNNPRKIIGLEGYGLRVTERVPLEVGMHPLNEHYLRTKKEKMGHIIS